MAIPRTSQIDDDGSGTTGTIWNNAWKTELYNQIDTIGAPVVWIPTDASGAGLTFGSGATSYYVTIGKTVIFWGNTVYPVTANSSAAQVGGFPIPNGPGAFGGGHTIAGPTAALWMAINASTVYLTVNGVAKTNADLSGANVQFVGQYLMA